MLEFLVKVVETCNASSDPYCVSVATNTKILTLFAIISAVWERSVKAPATVSQRPHFTVLEAICCAGHLSMTHNHPWNYDATQAPWPGTLHDKPNKWFTTLIFPNLMLNLLFKVTHFPAFKRSAQNSSLVPIMLSSLKEAKNFHSVQGLWLSPAFLPPCWCVCFSRGTFCDTIM